MIAIDGALANTFELRIIAVGDGGQVLQQILDAALRRYPGAVVGSSLEELMRRTGESVYVAIGPAALQAALNVDLNGPLLSVFVSNDAYTRLLKAPSRKQRNVVTAIYAEAAPEHQMEVLRALYGRHVEVGVLLDASTARQEPVLRRAAQANDLAIDCNVVAADESIVRALVRLQGANALLCIPDQDLYTPTTFRVILETTYRHRQAVIGYTASMVTGGALAAAYSTVDDVAAQIGDAAAVLAAGRNMEPQYPAYWRVAVNESVARSLNLVVEDQVLQMGRRPP